MSCVHTFTISPYVKYFTHASMTSTKHAPCVHWLICIGCKYILVQFLKIMLMV